MSRSAKSEHRYRRSPTLRSKFATAIVTTMVTLLALWKPYRYFLQEAERNREDALLGANDVILVQIKCGNLRRCDIDARIPFLGRPHRRVSEGYYFNNLGFRDDRDYLPYAKSGDEFRIAVLGDSVAFGCGLELYETFPRILEMMAREAANNEKIVVFNLAQSGFNTAAEHGVFDHFVIRSNLGIRVCIFQFLKNDNEVIRDQKYDDPWFSSLRRLIAKHNHREKEFYFEYLRRTLSRMKRDAERYKIKLFFLPCYDMNEFEAGRRDEMCRNAIRIAREAGVPVIDAFSEFERVVRMYSVPPCGCLYFRPRASDHLHPNMRANTIIARVILDRILPLLPRGHDDAKM